MSVQPIDLKKLEVGQSVAGLVYIQDHGKHDGQSKAPLYGTLSYLGANIRFKVWTKSSQSIVDTFNTYDCAGKIATIVGDVTEYQSRKEITITAINYLPEEQQANYKPLFIKSADINGLSQELWGMLQTELTENHRNFAMEFFQTDENTTWNGFLNTWAGSKMHDAQLGGLLNHTVKIMRITKTLLVNDPRLQQLYSLLQLCNTFHDIGKLREINLDGVYTDTSFITHRSLGIEMMVEKKELCLRHLTKHEYYILLSVIQGHHGDFGDAPTSLLAYWMHHIDMLESKMTMFLDKIENNDFAVHNGNNCVTVPFSSTKLVL